MTRAPRVTVVIPNEVRDLRLPLGGSPRIHAGEERFSVPKNPRSILSGFSRDFALVQIYGQERLQANALRIQAKRTIRQEPHPWMSKGRGTPAVNIESNSSLGRAGPPAPGIPGGVA
jgi:hypothetical protein